MPLWGVMRVWGGRGRGMSWVPTITKTFVRQILQIIKEQRDRLTLVIGNVNLPLLAITDQMDQKKSLRI